jgi:hypothetical protein
VRSPLATRGGGLGYTTAPSVTRSHKIYMDGVRALSVPQRHPHLKPEYVEQALDLVGEAAPNRDGDDKEEA